MATRKDIIGLLLFAAASATMACGGDSNDDAPPDSGNSFERRDSGTPEADQDAGDESDADADAGDTGSEDTLTASESEAKAKSWVTGCHKQPNSNEELLNSCASGFRKFDERLYPASWKKDQLPPLP